MNARVESGGLADPHGRPAVTIWFTGLPCSGKTTLARGLAARLEEPGRRVEVLDGDVVRARFSPELGFSRVDRETNIRRIALLCELLNRHGIMAIVAAISPFAASRDAARRVIEAQGAAFVEIHCQCPLEELRRRDVKGLYRRADQGEVPFFTGVSDPYEEPAAPEIRMWTDREPVESCVGRIVDYLREKDGFTVEPELASVRRRLLPRGQASPRTLQNAWRTERHRFSQVKISECDEYSENR